jgi:hypothetical protein
MSDPAIKGQLWLAVVNALLQTLGGLTRENKRRDPVKPARSVPLLIYDLSGRENTKFYGIHLFHIKTAADWDILCIDRVCEFFDKFVGYF